MSRGQQRYGWPIEQWERAKDEVVSILGERAQHAEPIFYGDLAKVISAVDLEPHGFAMNAILDEVSRAEDDNGRGMLSVVVVTRETSLPGDGFFKLAKELGRDTSDREACWMAELEHVRASWGGRS
jgi:hypothetical protein